MKQDLTWLQDEALAYPNGGQTRKGVAVNAEDGMLRRVFAGIPDTYFTIPAHMRVRTRYVRGQLEIRGCTWVFFPFRGK